MTPRFSVITPVYNGGALLLATAESVMSQTISAIDPHAVQYIVVDGGSTDGSLDALRQRWPQIEIISEPDEGMYDALAKGLERATGEIHCYLNAGDFFQRAALSVVDEVMRLDGVEWITGAHFHTNQLGQVVGFKLPYRYRRQSLVRGLYGLRLPSVQQESTFWSRDLSDEIDLDVLRTYRLAGDHYLWHTFGLTRDLFVVRSHLGGFTFHDIHLSDDLGAYREECLRHSQVGSIPTSLYSFVERLMWKLPDRVKLELNRTRFITFDRRATRWVPYRNRGGHAK